MWSSSPSILTWSLAIMNNNMYYSQSLKRLNNFLACMHARPKYIHFHHKKHTIALSFSSSFPLLLLHHQKLRCCYLFFFCFLSSLAAVDWMITSWFFVAKLRTQQQTLFNFKLKEQKKAASTFHILFHVQSRKLAFFIHSHESMCKSKVRVPKNDEMTNKKTKDGCLEHFFVLK